MAIQNRRGAFKDFNPSKMLPGEFAVTTDGSNKIFMGFNPGVVKEVALHEQIPTNNNQLENGADYATVTQVTQGLDLKVDKTTQKQVDDAQNTEIESLKRKDLEHDNSINLINQNIETINTKDSKQDVAIKKNADDILTKVDKTTQSQKDLEQDDAITNTRQSIVQKISEHNVSLTAHGDIRSLVDGLTARLNALADSDDETLDQLSEIVAYIKSNKSLIENVTTTKVNVADIIDNLTTNVPNKPLSASMGVELKRLIDAIKIPTKVSELQNDSGYLTEHQDISGKVDKAVQGKKDAEQDEQINKNKTDILSNAIKPQATGNPIVLKDSTDNKALDLEINGSTSQVQTTGKNLWGGDKFADDFVKMGNAQKNEKTKQLIVNGSTQMNDTIYYDKFKPNTVYTFIFKGHNNNNEPDNVYTNMNILYTDGQRESVAFNKSGYAIAVTSKQKTVKCIKGIYIVSQVIFDYEECGLFEGELALEDFESYTGGKPSPSPEYPQEIVNGVVDSVSCNGKNLIIKKLKGYAGILSNPQVWFEDEQCVSGLIDAKMLSGETLTASSKNGNRVNLAYIDTDTPIQGTPIVKIESNSSGILKHTFKVDTNLTHKFIVVQFSYNSKADDIQVEIGSQPTPYEPHKGFTSKIPPIELSKWDKIKKIDGVWKKENCTTHYPSYNSEPITTGYYSTTGELSIGAEVYCRKEPTYEILPPETQEVLNKIQTFYPNSTIQTNDGIELNLTYIADTKTYIDNEIAEIKKAIVATGGV